MLGACPPPTSESTPSVARNPERMRASIQQKDASTCAGFSRSAQIAPGAGLRSSVFGSIGEFAEFIKGGVSSYTPSVLPDAFARLDLLKEDTTYQPMEAIVDLSWLDGVWRGAGMKYDCTVFATGAKYTWTYQGLWEERAATS